MTSENELSEREKEILRLVATGASNKEIAQQLYISPNTVKVHLRNIFSKIGVVSRTEATLYAIKIGLVRETVSEEIQINPTTAEVSVPSVDTQETQVTQPERFPALKGRGLVILLVVILLGIGFFRMSRSQQESINALNTGQRWSQLADLPEGIGGSTAERYEGMLYVFGGEKDGRLIGDVFAYDIIQDTWQQRAAKPTVVTGTQAAVLGEKIYFPGGKLADDTITKQVEIYDPRNNVWMTNTPLPVPLTGYGLAVFEGRLYLFGGWDGTSIRDEVWMFDPDGREWLVHNKMPTARAFLAAVALGNKIYLFGGETADGVTDEVLVFYPNRNGDDPAVWEKRPPLPQGRKNLKAVVLADGAYVAGGFNQTGQPVTEILRFNETSGMWEVLEPPPLAISFDTALTASQTRLHFLGGTVGMRTVSYHQAYQAIYTVVLPAVSR